MVAVVGGFFPVHRLQGIVLVHRLHRLRLLDRLHWFVLLRLLDRLGWLAVLGTLLEVTVVDHVQPGVPGDDDDGSG